MGSRQRKRGQNMASTRASVFLAGAILLFAMSCLLAQSVVGSVPFSISFGGAASFVSQNPSGPLNVGFARILRANPLTAVPDGFAILQLRLTNILISETT